MRRNVLYPLLMVGLVGIAKGQPTAPNDADAVEEAKTEVLKVDAERDQALQKGDVDALDRMYADGMVFTNGKGELFNKAQFLANFRSRKLSVNVLRHDDYRVHIYGDTAVITARSTSDLEYQGKVYSNPRRFTNVYVKQKGRWMLVVHDETDVVPAMTRIPPK